MPVLALAPAAATAFWGATGAAAAAGAGIYGAHKQADATQHAGDLQSQANAAALAEQKRQDDLQKQEFDQQQAAAKAQWDAQQQNLAPYRAASASALSSLGDLLGVPLVGGQSGGASAPPSSAPSGPTPAVDGSPASIAAYYKSRNTTPASTSVDYWVSKWPELIARGKELGDPNYAMKRLSQADEFGGGGSGTSPLAAPPSTLAPFMNGPTGPATNTPYSPVIPISQLM